MTDARHNPASGQRERELIAAAWRESSELATARAPLPPPEPIPGYRLIREIGRGGMGIVYEAEQEQPRRFVALKMISGGTLAEDQRVRMFEREIQTLARLRHPAIAAIYDAGRTAHGYHFFTMELVRGHRLTDYVRLQRPSRVEKLKLFCRICDAVHYAHQRGVIHRDLKPGNVIVDDEGNPKILDFGLARIGGDSEEAVSSASLEVGKIMGTLPYMSPEQARVRPDEIPIEVDVRSDVYSLGVLLYELLTGRLPYDVGKSMPHAALRIICEQPPRRPSLSNRALRGDLDTILLKCLAKEPGRRYDSALQLAEDIQRHLEKKPIRARPPSVLYLTGRWIIRHQTEFVFLIMIFVVVPAFVIMLWVQSARAQAAIRAASKPTEQSSQYNIEAPLREQARELEDAATSAIHEGEYRAAEWLLRSCIALRQRVLGANHGLTAYAESLLGETLMATGHFPEAEELLIHSYPIVKADHAASVYRKRDAAERLVRLYELWGRPAQADAWRPELEFWNRAVQRAEANNPPPEPASQPIAPQRRSPR